MNTTNPYAAPETDCLDIPPPPPEILQKQDWGPGMRLSVTLGVLCLVVLLGFLRIPLIRWDGGSVFGGSVYTTNGSISLLLIGLVPIIVAFMLVEIIAMILPKLRAYRHGGFQGRAKLQRAALMLAMGLIVLNAFQRVRFARSVDMIGDDAITFFLTSTALILGSSALLGLMTLVERHGLGNGFSVVLAGTLVTEIIPRSWLGGHAAKTGNPEHLVGGLILLILLPVLIFSQRPKPVSESESMPRSLPVPTSGLQPLALPASILGVLNAAVSLLGTDGLIRLKATASSFLNTASMAGFVSVALLCILFSLLFNRHYHVMEPWARLFPDQKEEMSSRAWRMFGAGLLYTLVFLLVLTFLQILLNQESKGLDLVVLVTLAFIGMDLVKEWRFRNAFGSMVSLWPLHRVHAVGPVVVGLRGAAIPVFTKGLHHRSLMHFFGPLVPIEILVPADRAEEALPIVKGLLAP